MMGPRIAVFAVLWLAGVSFAGDDACTPRQGDRKTVVVSFAPPEGGKVAGVTMIDDNPERNDALPGAGTNVAKDAIGGTPTGAVVGANDSGTEVKIVLAAPGEITPGPVVELGFDRCEGGGAVAAGDFACRVVDASYPMANLVRDVTCRVAIR
jgi:hypothetical protein